MGMGDGFADESAGRALGKRPVDELVAVGRLAPHRDEQVALPDFAAVEGDARNGERRRRGAACGLSDFGGGPEVGHLPLLCINIRSC